MAIAPAVYTIVAGYSIQTEAVIREHHQRFQGIGPIPDHPDPMASPVWDGQRWNRQAPPPNRVIIVKNGLDKNIGYQFLATPDGRVLPVTLVEPGTGIYEFIQNIRAPDGTILPVSDNVYERRYGSTKDWEGNTRETSCGPSYLADKKVVLVATTDEKGITKLWFEASIVRKYVEPPNVDHFYKSNETFDYGGHGFVKINEIWVDRRDPKAVELATNRYKEESCVIL